MNLHLSMLSSLQTPSFLIACSFIRYHPGMKRTLSQKPPTKAYLFRAVIEPDQDVYHAYCPALKGCHTWGHTYDEALQNLQEAVQCHVETLLAAGDPVPMEPAGDVEVKLAPTVAVNI